jgi:catechol 2,3-dioxygenase-like lactoylglutathione lyase family enzyme
VIAGIDHFVLTVRSLDATCAFYARALGMTRRDDPKGPTALTFGTQKINLHQAGHTFEPKARTPTPGAGDFCLVSAAPLDAIADRLAEMRVSIELGPVSRRGARGPMTSLYFRDPDGNLVEVSHYPD